MKCKICKKPMTKEVGWSRELYYKVSNLIKFNCNICGSEYIPVYCDIATNSVFVEFLLSTNNTLLNKIGLFLAYDYTYIEYASVIKGWKKDN